MDHRRREAACGSHYTVAPVPAVEVVQIARKSVIHPTVPFVYIKCFLLYKRRYLSIFCFCWEQTNKIILLVEALVDTGLKNTNNVLVFGPVNQG